MTRTLLVVAKAPVPGLAKTRLIGTLTAQEAAELASAALLDTLYSSLAVPRARVVVAVTGDFRQAMRCEELLPALRHCAVVEQRGSTFVQRLVAAHADAGAFGGPVLQVGMDTPQLTEPLLDASFDTLADTDAVLGRAEDGGWWALGLHDPGHAAALASVTMSTDRTGDDTLAALARRGVAVALLPTLVDVDTWDDARHVAGIAPASRFAAAVALVRTHPARGVA
ncbi:DUF2064 domain-containing protein [Nakamurella sp. A5-74]|uniref:DUF2064 domain-containing protein n=1 Tax=Nakamurella sp. A5-74 TaxID=3158264 RepID=A0AAU8DRL0_9ACTN